MHCARFLNSNEQLHDWAWSPLYTFVMPLMFQNKKTSNNRNNSFITLSLDPREMVCDEAKQVASWNSVGSLCVNLEVGKNSENVSVDVVIVHDAHKEVRVVNLHRNTPTAV